MIKDYANRSTHNEKPRHKRTWLTLVVISLAIVIPAGMFYMKHQKNQPKKPLPTPIAQTPKKTPRPKKTQNNNNDFDFYTLLPAGST